MIKLVAVGVGAAAGALCRYALSLWAVQRWGSAFPYGTLMINMIGCFLIGLVMIAGSGRPWLGEPWRLLLVTGLLGGFTTFSAFGYETYQLLTSGYALRAALYILASVGLGTFAVFLGAGLGRLLRP